jgi:hypothetical protein
MNHMYIRHTIGSRLFLDSEKHNAEYSIERTDEHWKFSIHILDEKVVEDVLHHRDELNIFVIEANKPNEKSWYYSKDGTVEYDKESQNLIILADVKVDYAS